MKRLILILPMLAIAACGNTALLKPRASQAGVVATAVRPVARPEGLQAAPRPAKTARTVEDFDTTSAAERAAAAAAPVEAGGEKALGRTIASLGDPARPGFWLETPLVSRPGKGVVRFPATGGSAQVDLIPIDGPATAGSRLSLAAMRLIGAPLTGLPEVDVTLVE
ncbi:hypothetical protein VK792_18075 [Mesobacterium sp. TK19101]|uniref:D-galactarate dehydratase n=1 Tax=Mesobacterium hydrothermale TaxID=3111907 RepID=A0ABU6HL69_9RHOB|nr:hypothetical protein [Mesobacterium sp. TK19101]MEC3863204.1 hypothetical protein [Mesobacterium sp. TK19101]